MFDDTGVCTERSSVEGPVPGPRAAKQWEAAVTIDQRALPRRAVGRDISGPVGSHFEALVTLVFYDFIRHAQD
jgi:hypothetical protein